MSKKDIKSEKLKALETTINKLSKSHGKGSVMRLGDAPVVDVESISTGSLGLDVALGTNGFPRGRIIEIYGQESSGKAQPLYSKILTPTGFITMGEVEVGTIINTPSGDLSTVIGVFPQGIKKIFRVTFDDKTTVDCCEDHLWLTYSRDSKNNLGDVVSTKELLSKGLVSKNKTRKYRVPKIEKQKMLGDIDEKHKLPIDPYLFGLLLGDGSFRQPSIDITTADEFVLHEVKKICNEQFENLTLSDKSGKYTYRFKHKVRKKTKNELALKIIDLGLYGLYSNEKYIPQEYLLASIDDRISLLQGMMDSDGTCSNSGTISFTSTSKEMSEGFEFLCRSLGLRCTTSSRKTMYTSKTGNNVDGKESYRSFILANDIDFNIFRLPRKQNLVPHYNRNYSNRYIESIEYIKNEECQCIMVGHPDSLYITDGFTATHNTTLTIHAIAECQKKGGIAAFVDAEHAFDRVYAQNLGVDVDNLIFSQPDCGEDALEIAEGLIRSNAIDLLVIDSVAALVPKAEIEGEMGDSKMGLQARLMSQAMRKLASAISKANCCVIFINQIREKIGVMFGCFHYNTKILLSDGTTEKIGKIVNQKMDVEVMSYNSSTGNIEPKKIVSYFNNGNANKFYRVIVDKPYDNGKSSFVVGDDHLFPTPTGEKKLSELKVGDKVYGKHYSHMSKAQNEFALGMFLGDSSLRSKNNYTCNIRTKHCEKQNEYSEYKRKLFSEHFISSEGFDNKNQYWFDCKSTTELNWLSKYKKGGALTYVDADLAKEITIKSLAIWYLDDGTFSGSYKLWGKGKSTIYCTKLDDDSKSILAERFVELGLPKPSNIKKGLQLSGKKSYEFQKAIAKYVPKSMEYKLHPKLRNGVKYKCNNNTIPKKMLIDVSILSIDEHIEKNRQNNKFDIEVEGNHNYFVDGVLVHNSPETTTGGNALKFYASQRLRISKKSAPVKDRGGNATASNVTVKVIKNKLAPPYQIAQFDIEYGTGISKVGEIVDMGVDFDIIEKSGSWYSYNGSKLGQGRENAKVFLLDNPELADEIEAKIKEQIFG